MNPLSSQLNSNPVIAAINDEHSSKLACQSDAKVIFILGCNICSLPNIVDMIKTSGKIVFVHVDLVEGLGKDTWAISYLKQNIKPHGIISTRHNLVKFAKDHKLLAVQRMFLLDSASIRSGIDMAKRSKADFIELMPGVIPKAISSIKRHIPQDIIAGGMIRTQIEVKNALNSGAIGVSTSNKELWKYKR